MAKKWWGYSAATAMIFSPALAQAQGCADLRTERTSLNNSARMLAADNPGSALVFGSCVAVGASNYDTSHSDSEALGAFTSCAAIGCAVTDSYSNCVSVGGRLFIYALRASELETRMRREGCAR